MEVFFRLAVFGCNLRRFISNYKLQTTSLSVSFYLDFRSIEEVNPVGDNSIRATSKNYVSNDPKTAKRYTQNDILFKPPTPRPPLWT